jgi:integrase/recombinase XerD
MSMGLIPIPPPALPDAAILAGRLAANSIAAYRRDAAAYAAWCVRAGLPPLAATSLEGYRDYLAGETQASAATINRALSAVKRLVTEAVKDAARRVDRGQPGAVALPADLPAAFARVEGVKASALRDRGRAHARTRITPGDMRRLQEAPDQGTLKGQRDAALLAVLAGSGLRASEAARLTIGAIHQAGDGWLLAVVGKGQAHARDALLSKEAYGLVLAWLGARPVLSEYIFTSFTGGGQDRATGAPMSATAIWQTVQAYATACGLAHIKPHDLRRFLGTQLARRDIRQAQKALGHKSIETTARHYVLDELEAGLSDGLY